MNPDIQNKIDSEAMREFNGTTCTESNRNAFKYGASFVASILQDEIENSIQGEKLFELSQTNYKLLQHIETLTAKVKRYEEVIKFYADDETLSAEGSNYTYVTDTEFNVELLEEHDGDVHPIGTKARIVLNQGEGEK